MTQTLWILKALLSHWRRRPFQAVTVFLGLAIATALWSGVQALNAQSRASYDRAAAIVAGEGYSAIEARGGADISQADYIALRRAGWPVSPMLQGDIFIGGEAIRLVGIDPSFSEQVEDPAAFFSHGRPHGSWHHRSLPTR